MSGVRVLDVSKSFGAAPVVDHVSLDIADGEFVVLVGPSGCGKTTTLRMIAGLEDVSAGRIEIGDRDVTDLHPKDRNVAMVFQSYALYPHKTVAENMGFALRLAKRPKAEIAARVAEAARILELTDYLERRPAQLSGGQRQRVAVGRAIVRDPEVFLFDEPLSNLDAKLRTTMRGELIKLHHSLEATMVYVTHDQVEAMTMGDRIVVMDGGRVQQVGTPLEVYDDPVNQFVASFIGSPSMNLVAVEIERAGAGARARIGDQALDLPGDHPAATTRRAVLGIRPEHLTFDPAPTDAELAGTIDAIEHLGSETLVDLSIGGVRGVAKTGRDERLVRGSRVRLGVAPGRILAFDPEGGARLRGRPATAARP